MLPTYKKSLSSIKAQTKDRRDWLDQDQSILLFTDKFLIISAQQTLVVFGGSAKLYGYKEQKNQGDAFKT